MDRNRKNCYSSLSFHNFFSLQTIITVHTPPKGFPILRPNIPYKKHTDVKLKIRNEESGTAGDN